MSGYRYGEYHDGPDPLAPPFDARGALDELGDAVLDGADPSSALRDLLRRGVNDRRGLDDLLRRVREQQQEIRSRGRLDGILEQARALLDTAIGQERAELFPDPSDEARLREDELDALPSDTAQAIRELADYNWRSPAARQTFEQLKDLLRSEVLDSQFRGMKEVLQQPDPEAMQRVKDMMAGLNSMLEKDARGEHTQADFDEFMDRYGDMFPENPRDLEELVDSLVRRATAAQRLLGSLTEGQRDELAALMEQALQDAGLAAEMGRLSDQLRARRPEMDMASWPGDPMTGDQPLGLSDATTALADLADLADLEAELRQDYPGARLDDIDEAAIRRALGRQAVDDMEALRQTERELERQGYLQRNAGQLELTPKAVRRLGETALRRVFADLPDGGYGDHEQRDAGQAGEYTGATRRWEFGDEQAIDAPATVRNALLRDAAAFRPRPGEDPDRSDPHHWEGTPPRVRLSGRDFEVGETQRRASAAVCLLVDLSYSMALRGTWGAAKQTALALHALVPQPVPAGLHPGHRVLQLRQGTARDRPGRAGLGHGPGHQPASRPGAGWPLPGPAPGTRPGGADRDRRRADRAPAPGRAVLVRLAARAGDDPAHPGRGGQDDPAACLAQRVHAGRGRAADRFRERGGPAEWRPGASRGAGTARRVRGPRLPAHPAGVAPVGHPRVNDSSRNDR